MYYQQQYITVHGASLYCIYLNKGEKAHMICSLLLMLNWTFEVFHFNYREIKDSPGHLER